MNLVNLSISIPEIILVGGVEYMDLLDKEVQNALKGIKSADKALADAAEAWEGVTERYGRKKQIEQWKKVYGGNSRADQQLWYDVQVACGALKIDFDAVLKFMDSKRSKFKMKQLG